VNEAKIAVPFVASSPDPEVPAKPQRRKFSAEDKKRILEEADAATGHGAIGALLRREGMYSSMLANWRRERDAAVKRPSRRSAAYSLNDIRWLAKTRICADKISGSRKSSTRRTSSSMFKKKWPGC
jgi:transposase-like protein